MILQLEFIELRLKKISFKYATTEKLSNSFTFICFKYILSYSGQAKK